MSAYVWQVVQTCGTSWKSAHVIFSCSAHRFKGSELVEFKMSEDVKWLSEQFYCEVRICV
ncbi:hypothetical protein HanRHA438_Chr05g0211781 [Helianthus annuus]|nr:hypothetical protein HanRHA438_Chr05g0211781 [Helianthus annuus]